MLIPLPAMPTPSGAPSNYIIAKRPWMLSLLVAQTAICVLRMVLLLDIMGGFIMAICIGLGWYAWKLDMHITFICYWGMMCLINGAFDLVRLIDKEVKSPLPMFSPQLPTMYNVASFVLLAIPLVTLPGALMAWYMYKSTTESEWSGSSGLYDTRNERLPLNQPSRLTGSRDSGFSAFAGSGQRLGTI